MAFKNDWTPGIFPIIAEIVFVMAVALWISTLFDGYQTWVSIMIFALVVLLGSTILVNYHIKSRRKK